MVCAFSELKFKGMIRVNNAAQEIFDGDFLCMIFSELNEVTVSNESDVEAIIEYLNIASISTKALILRDSQSNSVNVKQKHLLDMASTLFSFIDKFSFTQPRLHQIQDDSIEISIVLTISHAGVIKSELVDLQRQVISRAFEKEIFVVSKSLHDHSKLYWNVIGAMVSPNTREFLNKTKFLNEFELVLHEII
ncbi:hypothetical protein VCHA53O466_40086 [Vibrio chagasii]|nr:hypothetical protein VCHA53O466_40086 [Vibrio chagasii]